MPVIRSIASRFPGAIRIYHAALLGLVDPPWSAPGPGRRTAAATLLALDADLLPAGDLPILERFLRESRAWALVDELAFGRRAARGAPPGTVRGARPGGCRRRLLAAPVGPSRAAFRPAFRVGRARSFLPLSSRAPRREGSFVPKATGSLRRDTARRHPKLVFDWILPRASRESGVTLREAIKALSDAQRARVLASLEEKKRASAPGGVSTAPVPPDDAGRDDPLGRASRWARADPNCRLPDARPPGRAVPSRMGIPAPRGVAVTPWRDKAPGTCLRHGTGALSAMNSGSDLLSQGVAPQVPSARAGLTSVFGMGTGVSPPLWPPET